MFGGGEMDFTEAGIANPPARIQTTILFGGFDLRFPPDWDVQNQVAAIFGGIEDKRTQIPTEKESPDLIITGTVLFGGLTFKN